MSVFGASVQRINLEIMSLPKSNTGSGMATNIERSATPTRNQPLPNSRPTMFTHYSTGFDIFPVS
jgi:hypothetical protein